MERMATTTAAPGPGKVRRSRAERRRATTDDALSNGSAIVVISTSSDETCQEDRSFVQLRRTDDLLEMGWLPLNSPGRRSDFPDHVGFVDAFVVQPGSYQLGIMPADSDRSFDNPIAATFQVEPGQVKYVGNVHGLGCSKLIVRINNAWAEVRQKFGERFPAVDADRVVFETSALEGGRPAYEFEFRKTLQDPAAPAEPRHPLAPAPALRAPNVPPVP
jgi:hypothetical protein